MAVHLPLSVEAQAEAHVLMLSTQQHLQPGERRADHLAVAGHRHRYDDGEYAKPGDKEAKPYLNPVFLMTESGARGSVDQIRQLAGMRALMAKPSGEIIETPIKSNFREGLSVLEYFSSTHGARKGLADTALKTADSGYLTRKLADVVQNVIINEDDCGTIQGVTKSAVYKGEEIDIPLRERIIGRTARDSIRNPVTDKLIVGENDLVTLESAKGIEELGLDKIRVRSALTCESELGFVPSVTGWTCPPGGWPRKAWPSGSSRPSRSVSRAPS
jgi:DNA-directed RNA polymerase subunit beta'